VRDAHSEVRKLFAEIRLTRDRLAWIAVALLPPARILAVLESLRLLNGRPRPPLQVRLRENAILKNAQSQLAPAGA